MDEQIRPRPVVPVANETPARSLCAVRGMIAPRAMCGHVRVGLMYCGFRGACEHKQPEAEPA